MARPYHKQALFATKSILVSASRVRVLGWSCVNLGAMAQAVQLYDANATTDVTVGTTVPSFSIPEPANPTAALAAGNNLALSEPMVFHKGLVIAFVEGLLDTTATASADATMSVNLVLGD